MKVVFMGTPEFAAVSLRKIYEHHEVAAIFTQPDKVNQRGKKIKFSISTVLKLLLKQLLNTK